MADSRNLRLEIDAQPFSPFHDFDKIKTLFNHPTIFALTHKKNIFNNAHALFVPGDVLSQTALCSATAYSTIEATLGKGEEHCILIICPSHESEGKKVDTIFLPTFESIQIFNYPPVNVATAYTEQLLRKGILSEKNSQSRGPIFTKNNEIFTRELSFLSQLPFIGFLSKINPKIKIYPIIYSLGVSALKVFFSAQTISEVFAPQNTILVSVGNLSQFNDFSSSLHGSSTEFAQLIRKNDNAALRWLSGEASFLADFLNTPTLDKASALVHVYILGSPSWFENKPSYSRLMCYYGTDAVTDPAFSEFGTDNLRRLPGENLKSDHKQISTYASLVYTPEPFLSYPFMGMATILTPMEEHALIHYAQQIISYKLQKKTGGNDDDHDKDKDKDKDDEPLPLFFSAGDTVSVGIFVTIKNEETQEVRGCVGTLVTDKWTIMEGTRHFAILAAFHDTRFGPLTLEEFNQNRFVLLITFLGELKDISLSQYMNEDNSLYEEGRDGINIISDTGKSAYFLPNVITTLKLTRIQQLENLCRKAGEENIDCYNTAKLQYNEGYTFL